MSSAPHSAIGPAHPTSISQRGCCCPQTVQPLTTDQPEPFHATLVPLKPTSPKPQATNPTQAMRDEYHDRKEDRNAPCTGRPHSRQQAAYPAAWRAAIGWLSHRFCNESACLLCDLSCVAQPACAQSGVRQSIGRSVKAAARWRGQLKLRHFVCCARRVGNGIQRRGWTGCSLKMQLSTVDVGDAKVRGFVVQLA